MPSVYRLTVTTTGFTGGPGYAKFSFSDLTTDTARNAAAAAVMAFYTAAKAYWVTSWTATMNPEVLEYDVATSTLLGAATITTVPTAVTGAMAAAAYVGGSGYCVTWKTSTTFAGRRVIGRTFMAPAMGVFENDGTITSSVITAMQTAGSALAAAASADFCVWAKSWAKKPDPLPSNYKEVQTGGQLATVIGCSIKDQASGLRSRRS
jgi:hypothetical protein